MASKEFLLLCLRSFFEDPIRIASTKRMPHQHNWQVTTPSYQQASKSFLIRRGGSRSWWWESWQIAERRAYSFTNGIQSPH